MAQQLITRKNAPQFPAFFEDMFKNDWLFPSFDFLKRFNAQDFPVVPQANIIENNKNFQIELAVPGLDRDDLKIDVDGNVVTITSEKEEEHLSEEENFRKREFSYNSFQRSFSLPENLDADHIEAKYEKGVLHLKLPKKHESKPSKVKHITVG
ncbi:MAG: Hsp20/alpha crystallin family protein [Flavobacterium sp.]|nr:MAG: Hsp20/alpha crystallin family protein [Flavobacterium sp.]